MYSHALERLLPSFLPRLISLSLVTLTFPDDPPGQGRDLGPNAEKLDKVAKKKGGEAKNWLERKKKLLLLCALLKMHPQ